MVQRFTLTRTVRTLFLAASLVVWLPTLNAQFSNAAAKVLVQTGQVSLLQDGYQVPLSVMPPHNIVNPKQVIITGSDGYAKFETCDGSTFEVFQNAKVTFRDNYPSWTDYVQVWIGRIRVQIDHHLGSNPNRVSTPTAVISVRGTIFDVEDEDQDDTTVVSVEEGVVEVRHRIVPSEIVLHNNESVRVFRNQPIAKVADHSGALRAVYEHARQAILDALYSHPGGLGGHGPIASGGSTGGSQGDRRGGAGGSTGSTGSPGTPPAPGTPPPPGGGH
jgi:hypothetical protein